MIAIGTNLIVIGMEAVVTIGIVVNCAIIHLLMEIGADFVLIRMNRNMMLASLLIIIRQLTVMLLR